MDYVKTAATALRILAKNGQDITLRNYSIGTYDPATGTNIITSSDTTIKGADFDFGDGITTYQGTLIQSGDRKCYAQAGTVISIEDHIIIGSKEYTIKGLKDLNPNGTHCLYTLHLRNG